MKEMIIFVYSAIVCTCFIGKVYFIRLFREAPDHSTLSQIYLTCYYACDAWLLTGAFLLLLFLCLLQRKFFCGPEALRRYFVTTLLAILPAPVLERGLCVLYNFTQEFVLGWYGGSGLW